MGLSHPECRSERSLISGRLIGLLTLIAVGACAPRPGMDSLATVTAPLLPGIKTVSVYAATTRARATEGENDFTGRRSTRTNYASFSVSVPPVHKAGDIEWPNGATDPERNFAVTAQSALSERDFFNAIAAAAGQREVGVFVHGYNVSYQEALFRLVQMAADADVGGVPVLFAWPSQASLSGYIADREAVTYSRDNLASMLVRLSRRRGGAQTTVLAHSMGSWLVMEALRQLKLQSRDDVLSRLKIVLAAPDIDEAVFEAQLAVIGPMRMPITVLVSSDDKALAVSRRLAGNNRRVGALDATDPNVATIARRNGVQIIDISRLPASDNLGHDRFVRLAAAVPRLDKEGRRRDPSFNEAGAFVLETGAAALLSPFRLLEAISP